MSINVAPKTKRLLVNADCVRLKREMLSFISLIYSRVLFVSPQPIHYAIRRETLQLPSIYLVYNTLPILSSESEGRRHNCDEKPCNQTIFPAKIQMELSLARD